MVKADRTAAPVARILAVAPGSPAEDAGFAPGCAVTAVDGRPVRDLIDWRWLAADDEMVVSYLDTDGDAGEVELFREEGEDWGFEFDGLVFDEVKLCRNACCFCFMRQLPAGMRPSLSMRDDDFRLSFLTGTFVTLTNLTDADERRILDQQLSPLRVSLHAVDHDARRALIGKHEAHGLAALDRLMKAGIHVHAQIVLVPDANDGDVLAGTLAWAQEQPNILSVGIVPLGYTKWQSVFSRSFNEPAEARAVLAAVEPFRQRALIERGHPWAFPADEFYRNAYPDPEELLERLPPASQYDDYSMFEDGIGIVRSYVDEFARACESGLAARAASALKAVGVRVRFVVGEAMQPLFDRLIESGPLNDRFAALTVPNDFFGGNVDVTGLLTAADVGRALQAEDGPRTLFLLPRVMFNDDGLTLDDATAADIDELVEAPVHVVSCNPLDYLEEIISLAQAG